MGKTHITEVQAFILAALRDGGRLHGLDIMKDVERRSGRALSGTLYRALHQLETAGYVEAEWEMRDKSNLSHKGPPRRFYWLNFAGAGALQDYVAQLDAIAKSVRPRLDPAGPTPRPS